LGIWFAGKGTQCEKLVKEFGYHHLSAGDLLRDEVKSGSKLGHSLEALMKEGKLVPQGVTIALLRNAMIQSGKSTFLIDGFPRALDQVQSAGPLFYDVTGPGRCANILDAVVILKGTFGSEGLINI
jgi:adenylate kinase family enzyme